MSFFCRGKRRIFSTQTLKRFLPINFSSNLKHANGHTLGMGALWMLLVYFMHSYFYFVFKKGRAVNMRSNCKNMLIAELFQENNACYSLKSNSWVDDVFNFKPRFFLVTLSHFNFDSPCPSASLFSSMGAFWKPRSPWGAIWTLIITFPFLGSPFNHPRMTSERGRSKRNLVLRVFRLSGQREVARWPKSPRTGYESAGNEVVIIALRSQITAVHVWSHLINHFPDLRISNRNYTET